ncbi:MAG: hypothetical protein ACO1SV_27845 [Fimbriimonas sp.]
MSRLVSGDTNGGQSTDIIKVAYIEEAIAEHVDTGREGIVLDRIRAFLP